MKIYVDKFFTFLIFIFPPLLITGPALPDIIITLSAIYFLFLFFYFKKNYSQINYWFFIALLFCIGSILSSIFAYNFKLHSLTSSLPYIRFVLFCFFLNIFFLKTPFNFFILINIIGLSIFFVSIDICIQYYFGSDIFGFPSTLERNSGPFGSELKGGSYISKFYIPVFTLFYFLSSKIKIYKSICLIFFIVCFLGLIFSGERAAILLFLISNLLFLSVFFFNNLRKFILFFLLLISFIVLVFTFLLSNDFKVRYLETTLNDIKSLDHIMNSHYGAHYITAYNIFLDYPLLGVGQNNFRNKCSDEKYNLLKSARIKDRCSTHPHNYYIQILSDLGLFNFLIFLILIFSIFYEIYIKKNITNQIIFYGKIISLFVILWPFVPTGSFYNNWLSSINWIIISLCISNMDKNYTDKLFAFLKYNKDRK